MSQYDIKRFGFLLFLLVGFGYLTFGKGIETLAIGNWAAVFWFSFLFSQLVNACFFNNQIYSFLDILQLLAISLAFVGYLRLFDRSLKLKEYLLLGLLYGLTFYYLSVLMQYMFFLISPVPWNVMLLSSAGFINVRFLNQIMVLMFPLVLVADYLFPVSKKIVWFCSIMTVALLFNSDGRGAMAMAIFESVVLILMLKHTPFNAHLFRVRLLKVWLIGLLVFLVFFVWIPSMRLDVYQMAAIRLSEPVRFQMWAEAFDLWRNNMWWAYGGMSFADKTGDVSYILGHPHNSIVQVLYEYGLIGLTCLVLALLFLLKRIYSHLVFGPVNTLLVPVFVSLLAGAGLSLVSGVIVMPFSQLILFVQMLVIVSIVYRREGGSASVGFRPPLYISIKPLIMIGIVVFFLLGCISYLSWVRVMGQETLTFDVGPRFWMIGRLEI
jgi:O-antigen ligase